MTAAPLAELLSLQNILILERDTERAFRPVTPLPRWLSGLLPQDAVPGGIVELAAVSPFLEFFLPEAEQFWVHPSSGELRSGLWTESAHDRTPIHLEAMACVVAERKFLVLRRLETEFDQLHRAYQKGRDLSLTFERLLNETNKKEILLHCIIHDLLGPLSGIIPTLDILRGENLTPGGRGFLENATVAAQQQANFIHELLETFRAEVGAMEGAECDPAHAPDIVGCARDVLDALNPAFAMQYVTGKILLAPGVPRRLQVAGEKSRLERVFHNLLQNALRYSPPYGIVTVTIRTEDSKVWVLVEDEGPGVPADLAPHLFQKFVRGGKRSGKAGLGLFFCRITVEQWGGKIGCEVRAEGGSRFWFCLNVVQGR